jgi:hypothetical protein
MLLLMLSEPIGDCCHYSLFVWVGSPLVAIADIVGLTFLLGISKFRFDVICTYEEVLSTSGDIYLCTTPLKLSPELY